MRQSREATTERRQEIIAQASRLFRADGVEGTSVGDVMTAAGRTHGGFYRHFETKDALLQAALASAFTEMVADMTSRLGNAPAVDALDHFTGYYLSRNSGAAAPVCPIAALAGEVARGSAATKAAFGAGVRTATAALAGTLDGDANERQRAAIRAFAMAAGAAMIARACDAGTAAAVREACEPPRQGSRRPS